MEKILMENFILYGICYSKHLCFKMFKLNNQHTWQTYISFYYIFYILCIVYVCVCLLDGYVFNRIYVTLPS